jgi:redox-regulated HSP33 family molecular chaperone
MYTYQGKITVKCDWCRDEKTFIASDKSLSDEKFMEMVEEMTDSVMIDFCDYCNEESNWSVKNYELPKLVIKE